MDIRIENHGSIVLIRPLTDTGRHWLSDNVANDAQRWTGAVVVEPRYVVDIVQGAQAEGLEVG